jgi:hypothetical protein
MRKGDSMTLRDHEVTDTKQSDPFTAFREAVDEQFKKDGLPSFDALRAAASNRILTDQEFVGLLGIISRGDEKSVEFGAAVLSLTRHDRKLRAKAAGVGEVDIVAAQMSELLGVPVQAKKLANPDNDKVGGYL